MPDTDDNNQPPGLNPQPITTALTPPQILEAMSRAARSGDLPDYAPATDNNAFTVTIFGEPYDRRLTAHLHPDNPSGTTIRFSNDLKPRTPAIVVAVIAFTIWPGVWLTDSMLVTYFSWYRIETWWWYIPLTLLAIPALWKQYQRSERAAAEHTRKITARIHAALGPAEPA